MKPSYHREIQAALLLWQHCQIRCQIVDYLHQPNCWRVDLPDGCTTLVSNRTLLLLAERRLPAGMWQRLAERLI